MNVVEILLQAGDPSAPAVMMGAQTVTYAELRQNVERIAKALLSLGHAKGDRVGIWAENSAFFVSAYLGIMRAGLVAVPFQTETPPTTFQKIVGDAEIKTVLVSKRFAGRVKQIAEPAGIRLIPETAVAELPIKDGIEFPEISAEKDLASLMFTSGSTGAPKGVMVTHQNIAANTSDIASYMGLSPADRVMVVLPFHYCFGLSVLHSHLFAGASLNLNNQFMYPESVLDEMASRGCTGLAGVPSTYQILLRKTRFKQLKFPALRWLQQAGGKLHNPFIQEIIQTFPEVKFYIMYGQTEATARLSYLPPDRLGDKLGSIGKGLPSTRLEVLKSDGTEVIAGSEEVGEIVASGRNVTAGYWKDPVETEKFFRNGRLHTGNLARVDPDGFIFVVEREREMIKSAGNRVSAKEVEDVIAEIPAVVEVAVVGIPDELMGETIKAFIVLARGQSLSENEVIEHCRKRLPAFKCPVAVEFRDKFPHTSSGKVVKRELAKS